MSRRPFLAARIALRRIPKTARECRRCFRSRPPCRNVRKKGRGRSQRKARNRIVRTIREYDSLSRSRFSRYIPCRFLMDVRNPSMHGGSHIASFPPGFRNERLPHPAKPIADWRGKGTSGDESEMRLSRNRTKTGRDRYAGFASDPEPDLPGLVARPRFRWVRAPLYRSVPIRRARDRAGRKYVAAWALMLMPLFPGDAFSCGRTAVLLPGRRLQADVYVFFMLGCTPPSSRTLRREGFSLCTVRKAGEPNPCGHSPASCDFSPRRMRPLFQVMPEPGGRASDSRYFF